MRQQCVVSLRQATVRPSIVTATENVGMGGVCVLLDEGLEIFAAVDVELTLSDGQPPFVCQGVVAWVVRRREMNRPPLFDTGIEFVGLTPETQARLQQTVAVANRASRS